VYCERLGLESPGAGVDMTWATRRDAYRRLIERATVEVDRLFAGSGWRSERAEAKGYSGFRVVPPRGWLRRQFDSDRAEIWVGAWLEDDEVNIGFDIGFDTSGPLSRSVKFRDSL